MSALPELTQEIIIFFMAHQLYQYEEKINLDHLEELFKVSPYQGNQIGLQASPMPLICVLCSQRIGATLIPTTYRNCNTCGDINNYVADKRRNYSSMRLAIKQRMKEVGYTDSEVEYLYIKFVDMLHRKELIFNDWADYVRGSLGVKESQKPRLRINRTAADMPIAPTNRSKVKTTGSTGSNELDELLG